LPWTIEGREEVEIAYLLEKHYWRQGLGAEVAQGLVRYGFEKLKLSRLIALIDPEHEASRRTAEAAGLVFEREVEMHGLRTAVYAIKHGPTQQPSNGDTHRRERGRIPSWAPSAVFVYTPDEHFFRIRTLWI
jgi:hypothetical protein